MKALRRLWGRRELLFSGLALALAALAWRIGVRQAAAARPARTPGQARLREAVRAELGRGETVTIDGWLLSRSEARLAADRGELPSAEVPESRR